MSQAALDARLMARALQLAARVDNAADPNPRVGCVIARGETVIGEGWHHRAGTGHAEVNALADAGASVRGATAYVTLEPCAFHGRTPACAGTLVEAGVARVVVAVRDPHPKVAGAGSARLREAGIEVLEGCMAEEARALNRGFFSRYERGRPWVVSKHAISLDGATAMADGEASWITGPAARQDVQRMRAGASAMLTGIGTVLGDDPSLNVRLPADAAWQQPLRVIADSSLRTPPSARTLRLDGEVLICHLSPADASAAARAEALTAAGASLCELPAAADGRIDPAALLVELAARDINTVMVEAGAVLNGALLQAGLVDEFVVYLAPLLMGSGTRRMFETPALSAMADRQPLTVTELRRVGDDLRMTLVPAPAQT